MKNIINILFLAILVISVISCNNSFDEKEEINDSIKSNKSEKDLLINFLETNGNFVNSDKIPALVLASELESEKENCMLIDLRKHDDYILGHIDGAINVKYEQLYDYMFDTVVASVHKKIVFIGYNGQEESFATSVFRILGFGNVYSLKFGMSAWNKKFANDYWLSAIGNDYANKLETTNNPKNQSSELPEITTGNITGYDIAKAQAKKVLAVIENNFITIDELMQNPQNFYIINYWDTARYLIGHLPGAVQYEPDKSLSKDKSLLTIPKDKIVVVYCFSGQLSAQVVAFLNILGYNAKSLQYGNNSFMFNIMKSKNEIGKSFDASTNIMDFTFVEGELPSLKTTYSTTESSENKEAPKVNIQIKKETKKSSGGC